MSMVMREEGMEKELFDLKMNKKSFSVTSLKDSSDDRYYWFRQKPIERLKHIEILRRINYGHRATARLQRFFEIAER
jgi:hypothetical protein